MLSCHLIFESLLLDRHAHLIEPRLSELYCERNVGVSRSWAITICRRRGPGCVASKVYQRGDICLEPGVQVHRVEPVQVADDHARHDVQDAAQRQAQVRQAAAQVHAAAGGVGADVEAPLIPYDIRRWHGSRRESPRPGRSPARPLPRSRRPSRQADPTGNSGWAVETAVPRRAIPAPIWAAPYRSDRWFRP
jgi:hypothetical protein